jgi:hypothetical protein
MDIEAMASRVMEQHCHALNLNPPGDGIGSDWVPELTQKLMVETSNIAFAHLLISCDCRSSLQRAAYLVIFFIIDAMNFYVLCFQYVSLMIFI